MYRRQADGEGPVVVRAERSQRPRPTFATLSAIESVENYLRERGTGEGIPEEVRIRDGTLENFSTALLACDGIRQARER